MFEASGASANTLRTCCAMVYACTHASRRGERSVSHQHVLIMLYDGCLQTGWKTGQRVYATHSALQRASRAMLAAAVAAGLLTASTYQAMYAPYVSNWDGTERGLVLQAGRTIVSSAQAYYAFRLLNALSFASSVLCVTFAAFVLWEIAVMATYRPLLFRCSFLGLLAALFTAMGAALCGVLVFLGSPVDILGVIFMCLVTVALAFGFSGCISIDPRQGKGAVGSFDSSAGEGQQQVGAMPAPKPSNVTSLGDWGMQPPLPAPGRKSASRKWIVVIFSSALITGVIVGVGVSVGVAQARIGPVRHASPPPNTRAPT